MNTYACVSLISHRNYASAVSMEKLIAPTGSCFITNCILLSPTLIVNYINTLLGLLLDQLEYMVPIRFRSMTHVTSAA